MQRSSEKAYDIGHTCRNRRSDILPDERVLRRRNGEDQRRRAATICFRATHNSRRCNSCDVGRTGDPAGKLIVASLHSRSTPAPALAASPRLPPCPGQGFLKCHIMLKLIARRQAQLISGLACNERGLAPTLDLEAWQHRSAQKWA